MLLLFVFTCASFVSTKPLFYNESLKNNSDKKAEVDTRIGNTTVKKEENEKGDFVQSGNKTNLSYVSNISKETSFTQNKNTKNQQFFCSKKPLVFSECKTIFENLLSVSYNIKDKPDLFFNLYREVFSDNSLLSVALSKIENYCTLHSSKVKIPKKYKNKRTKEINQKIEKYKELKFRHNYLMNYHLKVFKGNIIQKNFDKDVMEMFEKFIEFFEKYLIALKKFLPLLVIAEEDTDSISYLKYNSNILEDLLRFPYAILIELMINYSDVFFQQSNDKVFVSGAYLKALIIDILKYLENVDCSLCFENC